MSNQNNTVPPNFWDWVNSEDRNSTANGPWTHARPYPQFHQADFNPLAGWAGPLAGMPYRTRRGHAFTGPAGHPAPPPRPPNFDSAPPPPPPTYEARGQEQEHGTHSAPPPPPQPEHELGDSADKEPMPPSPPASVPVGDEYHGPYGQQRHGPHHGHHVGHEHRGRGGVRGRGGHHHRGRPHSRGGHGHGHGPRSRGSSPSPFPFDLNELASQFLPHLFSSNNNITNPFPSTNTRSATARADGSFVPAVDIFDTPSKYLIHASLPGAKKSDIDVSWNAQTSSISISGVVHRPAGVDEEMLNTMVADERKVGLFERSIKLDSEDVSVDVDGIGAKLEEGILIVTVPKLLQDEWTEVRKVDIE